MSKIGNTPLIELKKIEEEFNLYAKIFAKDESKNQTGSIKDRAALAMIRAGIKEGKIKNDTVIIEPTSGNTGIGLAYVAANLKLKIVEEIPKM